jgi:tetrapyrrole methylase family protein / MazG family protein
MAPRPTVRIIGLGPAGLGGISRSAMEALQEAGRIFLRTEHHPAAVELSGCGISFESFDCLYQEAESFDTLYEQMAERVLAETSGVVAYAVPGHPLVGERSVALIIERARSRGVHVEVVPSPSFIEVMLESLQVSMDKGLKVLDALRIEDLTPSMDTPNIIYQVYDQHAASRVKLRLMEFFPDESQVCIVQGAGTDTARTLWVPLYELDRQTYDHLTSVYVPEVES